MTSRLASRFHTLNCNPDSQDGQTQRAESRPLRTVSLVIPSAPAASRIDPAPRRPRRATGRLGVSEGPDVQLRRCPPSGGRDDIARGIYGFHDAQSCRDGRLRRHSGGIILWIGCHEDRLRRAPQGEGGPLSFHRHGSLACVRTLHRKPRGRARAFRSQPTNDTPMGPSLSLSSSVAECRGGAYAREKRATAHSRSTKLFTAGLQKKMCRCLFEAPTDYRPRPTAS